MIIRSMNRRSSPSALNAALPVSVGVLLAGAWTLAGCKSEPRTMTLETVRVERLWRRSVGTPRLELPPPRVSPSEGGVEFVFRPSATIDKVMIAREFSVVPTATVRGGVSRTAPVVDLQELAAEAVRSGYPALENNAEAVIRPSQIDVGEVVVASGNGRSLADVRLSIDPEEPRFDRVAPVDLAPGDVSIVAVRLVRRSDASSTLLEGRRVEAGVDGGQRFQFAVDGLGEGDCRRLRSLLIGDYAIVVDCEIKTGASSSAPEQRTFAAVSEGEYRDPIRRAARQQLEAIATPDPDSALSMELVEESASARRGAVLPNILVTNVSSRPVLALRAFSAAFQIRDGTSLAYAGRSVGESEPCLCPGETVTIVGEDLLDACGEPVQDAGQGLLAVVSNSGLTRRVLGPIPVEAVPRFGAQLLPPRTAAGEVVLEATSGSPVPFGALEVRLSFGGAGEIRQPFPSIPAGSSGGLRLPSDLDEQSAGVWAEWTQAGGRVDVELLEASLWDCEGAVPAKQAFRIGR